MLLHGFIARWFDGCYCHSPELKSEHVSFKRRRAMREACGLPQGKCPWVGKRLVSLAHGFVNVLIQRMKDCKCNQLNQTLMRKPRGVVARALEIIDRIKSRWSSIRQYNIVSYAHTQIYTLTDPHTHRLDTHQHIGRWIDR